MTAGQLAALIAAGFFALLACVACYVLLRLGRLLGVTTRLVTGYTERADTLLEQAQAVVDRTSEQLARTDTITASMDQVTANMAELSGHVSAMTGMARALTSAVGAPVTGISAVAYGVRRAVALRREAGETPSRRAAVVRPVPDIAPLGDGPAAPERSALPAGTPRSAARRQAARQRAARPRKPAARNGARR
ncbi:MAG TPA: DUF948 domain-containing protein [Streptosporangiaceae bacterium]|jgi:uncharacterized protein YoxC